MIDYKRLSEPFPADDIEWRVGSCGEGSNGVWAKVLAYITNRAIMNRLDEVCGPENWQNRFDTIAGGMICGISIYDETKDSWIIKYDGANNTDIESVKGGISDAMKRAGVQWGIGRYLYGLEEGWAVTKGVERDTPGARYAKTKEGKTFYWLPPQLPEWALPQKSVRNYGLEFAARCEAMGYNGKKSDLCYALTGDNPVTKNSYKKAVELGNGVWNTTIDAIIAKETEG